MKILEQLQKVITALLLFFMALSLLIWLGVFNPFNGFESATSDVVEDKLRVSALAGDADAQKN